MQEGRLSIGIVITLYKHYEAKFYFMICAPPPIVCKYYDVSKDNVSIRAPANLPTILSSK